MGKQNKIPTQEEFERVSKMMREDSRHLDEVRNSVKQRFETQGSLHEFFILDQRDVDFRVFVVFTKNRQLAASARDSIRGEIEKFVCSELEGLGKGKAGNLEVAFELDSHENVEANYEGDYYLRLR